MRPSQPAASAPTLSRHSSSHTSSLPSSRSISRDRSTRPEKSSRDPSVPSSSKDKISSSSSSSHIHSSSHSRRDDSRDRPSSHSEHRSIPRDYSSVSNPRDYRADSRDYSSVSSSRDRRPDSSDRIPYERRTQTQTQTQTPDHSTHSAQSRGYPRSEPDPRGYPRSSSSRGSFGGPPAKPPRSRWDQPREIPAVPYGSSSSAGSGSVPRGFAGSRGSREIPAVPYGRVESVRAEDREVVQAQTKRALEAAFGTAGESAAGKRVQTGCRAKKGK